VPIFFAGVLVTVFSTIENGIYTTIATSAALLLFRVFKARGRFVAPVKVRSVEGDRLLDEGKGGGAGRSTNQGNDDESNYRSVFLPIDHHDGTNPQIELESPYPGIFIYRFSEGYNYPNANHYLDYMVATIFQKTQRTNPNSFPKPGDRPWNNPGPRPGKEVVESDNRPHLKAIILDFSSVNNVDITSVQHLIDVRNQLDRYASPDRVEWHFACINNRWTKRALAAAGFGYPSPQEPLGDSHRWKPIFSVAEIGGSESAAEAAERRRNQLAKQQRSQHTGGSESVSSEDDIERTGGERRGSLDLKLGGSKAYGTTGSGSRIAVVHGLNRPYFHLDLTAALQSALSSTKSKNRKPSHHHGAVDDSKIPITSQTTA
jgi:sodium-independent sulfate anion transporter 11